MKLLEEVAKAREARRKADVAFQKALVRAREKGGHSWGEIAEAAGLSRYTVRYLVLGLNERRKRTREESVV